jgi:hypothetical protein
MTEGKSAGSAVEVVYIDPERPGYHPVTYMARLAAELLEAEFLSLRARSLTIVEKYTGLIPRQRLGRPCLLICPNPGHLASVLLLKKWRRGYGRIVVWVFDSFWTDQVARIVRFSGVADHVFVTEQEDIETWRRMVRAPVEWLPWGADVLRLGSFNSSRPIDLLRFGRQPAEWDDDASSNRVCESMQLRFQGRPPAFADASEGQCALMQVLGQAKFTLSFSNIVSPSEQVHPKREYLTGRWTDALSAGATVAGIPPKSETTRALLWEGALLDLATVDRMKGLTILVDAVRGWTPDRSKHNYLQSLKRLDWRWRFKRVAAALSVRADRLDAELRLLQAAIDAGSK